MTYRARSEARRRRTMKLPKRLRVFGCAHRFSKFYWLRDEDMGTAFCEGPCQGNVAFALRDGALLVSGHRAASIAFAARAGLEPWLYVPRIRSAAERLTLPLPMGLTFPPPSEEELFAPSPRVRFAAYADPRWGIH